MNLNAQLSRPSLRPVGFNSQFLTACTTIAVSMWCASAPAATVDLQAQADAYVRNANVANASTTNYGTDISLIANNTNGVRMYFLRFDLSGISDPITNLELKLTGSITSGAAQDFNVYGLASGAQENWTETGITWANAPGVQNAYTASIFGTLSQVLDTADLYNSGQILASFSNATTVGTIDSFFNVSSGPVFNFLNADADKVITFLVAEQDPVDTTGIGWNSKEASVAAVNKPTLTVTTSPVPEPGSVALLTLGMLGAMGMRRRRG